MTSVLFCSLRKDIMIEISKTKLDGVLMIKMDKLFNDHRGVYGELYSLRDYRECGIYINFVSHTYSRSPKGVLRGLHGDNRTWKLISCPLGSFYLVVLNFDRSSKQFGKWESFIISEENRMQILVPPNFCNGHYIMSETAIFHYLQSEYYRGPENQFTVRWNDPKFNIEWPAKRNLILSNRDQKAPNV